MGRAPCCEKVGLKRGRWTAEEDEILINYIKQNGEGSWRSLPKNAGLLRCGKSCRLRWINYLRADLKRGNFSVEEEETIIKLHTSVGNRWSLIASHLPGRTDNEVKNYWNSHLSRKIYSFKTNNGSLLNSRDVLQMTKSTTSKRRGGRVSRAIAKKYNKPIPLVNSTKPRNVTHDSCYEGQEVLFHDSILMGSSSKELGGGGGEIEVMGTYEDDHQTSTDDVTTLVDQFFLSELSDLYKISINNDEQKVNATTTSMVPENSINSEEWKSETWHSISNSSLDSGLLDECFSPLNSYFDDMVKLDTNDASIGFGLWD